MPQSAPVFDYDALLAFAQKHRQTALIDAANRLAEDSIRSGSQLLKNGRVVDVYRRINSEEEVRANHAGYMYFTRVGDDNNFVGQSSGTMASANFGDVREAYPVDRWSQAARTRTLRTGYAYLLRDFVRKSPDLALIEVEKYLQ